MRLQGSLRAAAFAPGARSCRRVDSTHIDVAVPVTVVEAPTENQQLRLSTHVDVD
jgi:hypothetical protein